MTDLTAACILLAGIALAILYSRQGAIMATLAEVKDLAVKVSADIDTKLADAKAKLDACEVADAALQAQLAAAKANEADPAVVQSIADTLTAADAKLI
jgi:hypothetical protein